MLGMENLAPEMLHEIYTLACIDGGITGCSLSLVSKSIRVTSRSARFHSVAISGTSRQLAAFLSCCNKERAAAEAADGYKPIVKHLFFAAAEGGEAREDWRGDLNNPGFFKGGADPKEAARRARVQAESMQYQQDLAVLFHLVSRDLRTLSFVHCNGWYEFTNLPDIVCPDGFPALREFYLYGKNPFVDVAGSPIRFPHLTHLRLPFSTYCHDEVFGDWADRAPTATHLCVSDVTKVSEELEDIAIRGGPFKRLGNLYLEPQSPPAPGGRCGNPYIAYGMFKRDFDNFLAASVRPIKVLPHRQYVESTESTAKAEWLGRVGGGVQCWSPIEPRPAGWVPAERKKVSRWG
ncbi:hypothetical protein OH76DRAFT_738788 [Lentinus brumalis]|uniref:F-box domain-containing protein n=1 Tax=Lentinus brumalis TaxID=2498619 RepID=A0A371DSB4_9APHY|nr:hypothetical protein OH76DRAFT_738788 [Polyporus brumalis]